MCDMTVIPSELRVECMDMHMPAYDDVKYGNSAISITLSVVIGEVLVSISIDALITFLELGDDYMLI